MLNISCQSSEDVIINFVNKVQAFQMKLELWVANVKDDNMDVFESSVILQKCCS